MTAQALAGITVIDLTTGIDGPFCTKMLADLGAQVIKIEPPGGDPTRYAGPFPDDIEEIEASGLFLYLNANKQSVVADVTSPRGREIVQKLASKADLLVENFSPGFLSSYELNYEALAALNPRLAYTSITPFGQYGPYADWKGPDLIRQAVSGWLYQGGLPERVPLMSGDDLTLYVTGVCAAVASLIAVLHAEATGDGQYVDLSAMEVMIKCTGQEIYRVSNGEEAWKRTGHRGMPMGIWRCKDGWVGINLLFPRDLIAFCELAEMEDILTDDRFNTLGKIRSSDASSKSLLNDRVREWVLEHDQEWLVSEGQRRRIPMVPVPTLADVLQNPQFLAREFYRSTEHPHVGEYKQPGPPYQLSATPWRISSPAPILGSSTSEVDPTAFLEPSDVFY